MKPIFFLLATLAPGFAAHAQPVAKHAAPKFALLVGINDYEEPLSPLRGCVNDVASMKASLVANFGFLPGNIKTLTNAQATHRAIVDAFRSQLIANAKKTTAQKPVVLFFYSGHGSKAQDTNGDEADGEDETIVPFDYSRAPDNRENYDIVDDQFDVLYKELAPWTRNITFIFDSCHSGTNTRGPLSLDGPRLKEALPDTRPYPIVAGATRAKGPDSPAVSLAPRGGDFVAIAGCQPQETSIDSVFQMGAKKEAHGALTFYLLQAMSDATRATTNGQIWQRAARGVSSQFPSQNPALEGRASAPFLGGATKSAAPPVSYKVQGDQLVIERGTIGGAKQGGFVAILDAPGKPPLARVQIARADAQRAYAPKPANVPATGAVELLTPYFGTAPVKVALDLPPDSPAATKIRRYFEQDSDFVLVKLVAMNDAPELVVKSGPQRAVETGAGNANGFYVVEGEKVVFNLFLPDATGGDISDDNRLALCTALENFAHQRNVRGLSNESSKLGGQIGVEVLQVEGRVQDDGFVADPPGNETPVVAGSGKAPRRLAGGDYAFDEGQGFKFRVTNKGKRKLYACVVGISGDGAVAILRDEASPDATFFTLLPGESGTTVTPFTSAPGGSDVFKVLVTTQPTDFSYLERDAVAHKSGSREAQTPLELLGSQMVRTRFGGAKPQAAPTFDDWASLEVKFSVSGQPPS